MPTWLLVLLTVAVVPFAALNALAVIDAGWIAHRYRRGSELHRAAVGNVLLCGGSLALQTALVVLVWTTDAGPVALVVAAVLLAALAAMLVVRRRRGLANLHQLLSGTSAPADGGGA